MRVNEGLKLHSPHGSFIDSHILTQPPNHPELLSIEDLVLITFSVNSLTNVWLTNNMKESNNISSIITILNKLF